MLPNGKLVIGNLTGTDSSQWKDRNGNTRNNLYLIISATYHDRYGNPQTDVTRIAYSEDRLSEVQKFATENKDERIAVPVSPSARNGRDGAFITYFMPNAQLPEVLEDV